MRAKRLAVRIRLEALAIAAVVLLCVAIGYLADVWHWFIR